MLMKNQGLRRFDLALDGQSNGEESVGIDLGTFPFATLRRALSCATVMERFSISVGAGIKHHKTLVEYRRACHILQAIPIKSWPHLRHFTLNCVPLVFDDFMKFLSDLPPTIQKLAFVDVLSACGYAARLESEQTEDDEPLLDAIADVFWKARTPQYATAARHQSEVRAQWPTDYDEDLHPARLPHHTTVDFGQAWDVVLEVCRSHLGYRANKPRFAVAQSPRRNGRLYKPGPNDDHSPGCTFEFRRLWVEDDIAKFFEGGPNPFSSDTFGKYIQDGFGVWRENFDKSFKRPNWRMNEAGELYIINRCPLESH